MLSIEEKFENLKEILKSYKNVAVAFSGGVDSTFLLRVAHDVLGDKIIAITAESEFFPKREIEETKKFCAYENIRQIFLQEKILSVENSQLPATKVASLRSETPNCLDTADLLQTFQSE